MEQFSKAKKKRRNMEIENNDVETRKYVCVFSFSFEVYSLTSRNRILKLKIMLRIFLKKNPSLAFPFKFYQFSDTFSSIVAVKINDAYLSILQCALSWLLYYIGFYVKIFFFGLSLVFQKLYL